MLTEIRDAPQCLVLYSHVWVVNQPYQLRDRELALVENLQIVFDLHRHCNKRLHDAWVDLTALSLSLELQEGVIHLMLDRALRSVVVPVVVLG